uniref:Uncharacterized protein n=1 Tax=Solanum lycopersicum TaxID=4081 RepID=A0A3Q7HAZ0_SOLLC
MGGKENWHYNNGNWHNYSRVRYNDSGVQHNGGGVRHIGGGIQHIGAIDEKKDELKSSTSLYKLIVSSPYSYKKNSSSLIASYSIGSNSNCDVVW